MTDCSGILADACRFYERHLTDAHRAYLRERYGLQPAFVEAMRIGYAPPAPAGLLMHLMDRGYSGEEIVTSGLVIRWEKDGRSGAGDLLRGRIVFPYLDTDLAPAYFIGRATPETPKYGDTEPAKYKKLEVTPEGPREPIFGTWSVSAGEPLIITEGVTDALAALQDSRSCISPVTTSFKRERIDEAAAWCKRAGGPVYIVNDNEESDAGLQGAARIARALVTHGIARVFIGTLPRPDGIDKTDLNDFVRSGGDLDSILAAATPAEQHPVFIEERRKERQQAMTRLRSALSRERWETSGKKHTGNDLEDLKARMPSLSAYTGILPGERGPHPVYGSTHGNNFLISDDGETWVSFHGGNEHGKSGNLFKLIALEQGYLQDEGMELRGEAFKQTIAYCRDRWGTPGPVTRAT